MATERCVYITGIETETVFYAEVITNGSEITFYAGSDVIIDWGDGILDYVTAGIITGTQIGTEKIIITSTDKMETFRFGTSDSKDYSYTSIDIQLCPDLISARRLCYQLEELTSFEMKSVNIIEDWSYAFYGCSSLTYMNAVNFAPGKNFNYTWAGCTAITGFENLDFKNAETMISTFAKCENVDFFYVLNTYNCTNFTSLFHGCSALKCLSSIDTSAIESADSTADMFLGTTSLQRPTTNEVAAILDGTMYNNEGDCQSYDDDYFYCNSEAICDSYKICDSSL